MAVVGECRQAAPTSQVHTGQLYSTLKVTHYLFVTNALMRLFLSSVSLMGEGKWAFFIMWHKPALTH